jgi:hypothetical protein
MLIFMASLNTTGASFITIKFSIKNTNDTMRWYF